MTILSHLKTVKKKKTLADKNLSEVDDYHTEL